MNLKRHFTETKILGAVVLIMLALGFLGSDAAASETHGQSRTGDVSQIEISAEDIELAMNKVLVGMDALDDYWKRIFAESELRYSTPEVYYYYEPIETACGLLTLENAFYCRTENAIYLDIYFFTRMMKIVGAQYGTDGDMAVITVLAHEWGHSVQAQTQNYWGLPMLNELGADCFAGAFVGEARRLGYIEPGDSEEARLILALSGDDAPWYSPYAHGSPKRRVASFLEGFENGIGPCQA